MRTKTGRNDIHFVFEIKKFKDDITCYWFLAPGGTAGPHNYCKVGKTAKVDLQVYMEPPFFGWLPNERKEEDAI